MPDRIMPNEHGVYAEGLEVMEFQGRHSKAELSLAHCEDGLWRYGLSAELRDTMQSSYGFGFRPNVCMDGYSRENCIKEACAELRLKIKMNAGENPLAGRELTAWINSLVYGCQQLSLF